MIAEERAVVVEVVKVWPEAQTGRRVVVSVGGDTVVISPFTEVLVAMCYYPLSKTPTVIGQTGSITVSGIVLAPRLNKAFNSVDTT